MENRQKIEKLFNQYLVDKCSQQEVRLLLEYFNEDENEVLLKKLIAKELEASKEVNLKPTEEIKSNLNEMFELIKKRIDQLGQD